MSDANTALDLYLTGLRNQHAVETQAIGTLQNEMSYTKDYPELYARMQTDKDRSTTQAARLDDLLNRHGSAKSMAKEAVAGAVATVSGFAHIGSGDDVLKNVLAAIGFKAYEIASYKALSVLADAAGASADKAVLEQSLTEEQEMGDWLGEHLPALVQSYLGRR
jgi:ferritin-like metal-binding protein YciE